RCLRSGYWRRCRHARNIAGAMGRLRKWAWVRQRGTDDGGQTIIRPPSSVLSVPQRVHAEIPIAPDLQRQPAAASGQRLKRLDGIFVAVLGMDRFAGAKTERLAVDFHLLPLGAGEVHLDPVVLAIVTGVMLEGGQIEIGAELAIDPRQYIEIEF